ncbi:MAG: TonB-dependent receptor [Ferruginibacter sp.]|nr:TonB-dependent receptor [Ferruginibacter sp.]
MKKFYLLLISVILGCSAYCQSKTGAISGTITAGNSPVERASISILKVKDSALVKIEISRKDGSFEVDHLREGNFIVSFSGVGYKTIYKNVTITPTPINFGNIQLELSGTKLADVTVIGKRPLIENLIDKTVVNVDASPTNTGLSAMEVLEKSPGVTIDNNDNISVKGKSGVIILIDGKPSYLSGQDLANYLKNMPSNQIDQIEIMTQPSAKYDASGNSGIINIKTKKNKANGFNGNLSTSAIFANYFKNTNSLNFNWRKNKINLFGNLGYAYWEGFNEITIDRQFRKSRDFQFNRYFSQSTFGKFKGTPQSFKLGVDYTVNKKTTVGVVVSGLIDKRRFTSFGKSLIYDSLYQFVNYNIASSQNKDPWTNVGFNGNIRHLINTKGREITADIDYILYRTKGKQFSDNYLYDNSDVLSEDPYLLRGYLPANIDIFSFKTDYTQPLKGEMKLEAGLKSSYVKTDNDAQYTYYDKGTDIWQVDNGRSNHFLYKENINAAYVNVNKQLKKWGVQVGLRAEQTVAKGNQLSQDKKFSLNYLKIFPTSYVSYKLNDKSTFGLSYGRRINRPGYQDLNPFQYLLDRFTYRQGNPDLQPQFSHNIEASYNYKGQLNISLNYTTTNGIINDVLHTFKTGDNYTTYLTKENLADNKNIGLSINWNYPVTKWWTSNIFVNAYDSKYSGYISNEKIDVSVPSFMTNVSNQFTFKKGWTAELSGFFQSKNLSSSVIISRPMGVFSLGGGKQILKGKGTVRVNLRDPFWIQKFRGEVDLDVFETQIRSKWDNRRCIITFNWRFGKNMQQQQSRRRNAASQDEQNRVNLGNGQQ